MEEWIETMLINSLDYGIRELDFWEMTPGEVIRAVNSKIKVKKLENQERASYDYILANLIVKGVGLTLGANGSFPSMEEAYPGLFDDLAKERTEKIQEQRMSLSALRFKQFAQSYNNQFCSKEVPKAINE